tara:strand:+ start:361 stop:1017 length:657 start_codon:yes stop_codon:yes gene_type:complete
MKNILTLEKILGIRFKNKNILIKSLTHKSYSVNNNERLEFLGDRVVGLILSRKLYNLYPNESEGILDKRFSKLVNKKTFYEISKKIKLQNFLFLGKSYKSIQTVNKNIASNACEALIGAIFLEHGYDVTEELILKLWKNHLLESNITIVDSKTKLQEYSLKKYKKLPIYKLENKTGPGHQPVFKISVKLENSKKYYGIGLSKQDAEQKAADKTLKNMD